MATNIFNYDGTLLVTVADGSINTGSSSIKFPGRGYLNYGEPINENMLWIMQNFASASAPTAPVIGQAWYDAAQQILKIYSGSTWLAAGGTLQSASAPVSGANPGALWFDTTNKQLNVWTGTAWVLVGPLGSPAGTDPINPAIPSYSTIEAARISDSTNTHQVWMVILGGTLFAIISKDAIFTPSPSITGFASISPGINFNTTISGTGLAGDTTTFKSTQSNLPSADLSWDLGSSGLRFSNVYSQNFVGTASSAKYADLAERYAADAEYAPGTVVSLGGSAEVTACRNDGDTEVFGVVSTAPAYLMNNDAGTNSTHPAVALVGRVPCKVSGTVYKGQRLMASVVDGTACAWDSNFGPLAVLGRSLVDKTTDSIELIEVVIGKN